MAVQALVQASILKRITALVYDLLVLTAISFCYGWLVLMIKYQLLETPLPESGRAEMGGAEAIVLLLLLLGFYCFFWMRGGQTLGMKAWKIRLLNTDNQPVSLKQSVVRCLTAPVCILAGGLGYIWCILDRDGRALQDRLSSTQVITVTR